MKIYFGLLLLVISFLACNRKLEERPIDKKDFVNLLIDLHMFDAVASDYSINSEMRDLDSATLYSSLLYKYNTNKDEFETTMRWYTAHPDKLLEIYDDVYSSLEKQIHTLNKQEELFNDKDNLKIWSDNSYTSVKGDTVLYPEPYIIEISDTGLYLFDITARLLLEDLSEAPFLGVYFIKNEKDSLPDERLQVSKMPLTRSNFTRDFKFLYHLEDTTYRYIKIIIPETADRDAGKEKSLQISKIRVLRRGYAIDNSTKVEEPPVEQTEEENNEAIIN